MDGLDKALEDYRADYTRYYEACRHDNSPKMRDPNPVIFLVPGVGMFSFAKDKATVRIAGEFYVNAINVLRGASTVSTYKGLPEQEIGRQSCRERGWQYVESVGVGVSV